MVLRISSRVAALVMFAVLALAPANAANPVFLTGSRVGLAPPASMVPSTSFRGFEDTDQHAAISITELPLQAYSQIEKSFTDDLLRSQGLTVERREELTLRDGQGFLIIARYQTPDALLRRWILTAKTSGITAVVVMQAPQSAKDYPDATFRKTFASFVTRSNVPQNEQLALLPYAIRELSGFRPIHTDIDGTALLTDGPQDTASITEQSFVLITLPLGQTPQPDEQNKYARQLFAAIEGFKDLHITRAEPLRIDGSPGYEIIGEAKDPKNDTDVTLVQWIRFGSQAHLKILGLVRHDAWTELYPRLRALRDGIEAK